MTFKSKLCYARRPETYSGDPNHCKRHGGHEGEHRIVYQDGTAYWNDGDRESTVRRPGELPKRKAGKK